MNCSKCGFPLLPHQTSCPACGTASSSASPAAAPAPRKPLTNEDLPEQFRVMSPWAYFGLQILYSIPVVGFIFLLIHTFSSGNLNRRSFARSYWCALLIAAIVLVVMLVICAIAGVSLAQLVGNSYY